VSLKNILQNRDINAIRIFEQAHNHNTDFWPPELFWVHNQDGGSSDKMACAAGQKDFLGIL
jgi:hypothetical protein